MEYSSCVGSHLLAACLSLRWSWDRVGESLKGKIRESASHPNHLVLEPTNFPPTNPKLKSNQESFELTQQTIFHFRPPAICIPPQRSYSPGIMYVPATTSICLLLGLQQSGRYGSKIDTWWNINCTSSIFVLVTSAWLASR